MEYILLLCNEWLIYFFVSIQCWIHALIFEGLNFFKTQMKSGGGFLAHE